MGIVSSIKRPEAEYTIDFSRGVHFAIDCACGGKSGSHYKNTHKSLEKLAKEYEPLDPSTKYKHTFYITQTFLLTTIKNKEVMDKEPLVIVCNDCGREFSFTRDTYLNLYNQIISEYNRKLREREKSDSLNE